MIQAIDILQQLLNNGKQDRSVYSVLGYCQFQIGDYQNAANTYKCLVKICPDIAEYNYYLAQCLLKCNIFDEALEVSNQLEQTHLQQKAKQLKASIYYERNEFQQAKQYLRSLNTSDFSTLVNEGCIYFKQQQYERALIKFNSAVKICGFNSELYYNIALSHFELKQYQESLNYVEIILQKAYDKCPELQLSKQIQELQKEQVAQILRETTFVEAVNLKSAILYLTNDQEGAREIIKQIPIIQEGGIDPVTFHNQAILSVNENSGESMKRLNHLMNNSLFPPETFQNLLFLYCQYQFFDLAAELIQENSNLCDTLLEKDDLQYVQALITAQSNTKEALQKYQVLLDLYKKQIVTCKKQIQDLQDLIFDGKSDGGKSYEQEVRKIKSRLRILEEKYQAVLTNQAKIYWDIKDFKNVEQIFQDSKDICDHSQTFHINLAHAIYMQEGKHCEAINHYEQIVNSHIDNLLGCETIVLANLCVCYILTKQNAKAESLILQLEQHEQQAVLSDPSIQVFHLCIVNLVIGTLYCSKGNFEFGITLIIKSLDPIKEKLGTDTWYYTKRCLLALIEKIIKKSFELKDSFYNQIINFLDEANLIGQNITTCFFVEQTEKQKNTVSYEAKFFKKIFVKLQQLKNDQV